MGKHYCRERGFTLVELAIVLVIIGLIIGGVLVGQDLIKAAEIRATVTDLEKFNSAAITFKGKYNALPGDIPNVSATAFGLTTGATPGNTPNGNGLIETLLAGANSPQHVGSESALFWRNLVDAQLIANGLAGATDDTVPDIMGAPFGMDMYLPSTKLRGRTRVHVISTGGRNYFYIALITMQLAAVGIVEGPGLQVNELYNMDTKMDDGVPNTGSVQAPNTILSAQFSPDAGVTPGAAACSSAAGVYNITPANISAIICKGRFRTSF